MGGLGNSIGVVMSSGPIAGGWAHGGLRGGGMAGGGALNLRLGCSVIASCDSR